VRVCTGALGRWVVCPSGDDTPRGGEECGTPLAGRERGRRGEPSPHRDASDTQGGREAPGYADHVSQELCCGRVGSGGLAGEALASGVPS